MSIERIHAADPGGDSDWHPGELRRALSRLEDAVAKLTDKVVVQAVYEVEQREQDNQIRQAQLRVAEDRAEHRAALMRETADREAWQAGMVGRMWWLAALAAGTAVSLLGVVVSIWSTLHK